MAEFANRSLLQAAAPVFLLPELTSGLPAIPPCPSTHEKAAVHDRRPIERELDVNRSAYFFFAASSFSRTLSESSV